MGPVRVFWELGEPPNFRSQRTKALLGYLAAEKRPISRDVLAAYFWPDETLSRAKANLRKELYNLNNILPGCWQTDATIVHFVAGQGVQVDIDEVGRLARNQQWAEAADFVKGDFLESIYLEDNLEFETWLFGERERRRQQAEAILISAAQAQQKQQNYPRARHHLTQLIQLLPWHEEGHRQMMRLLAYEGKFSAALKQYEQCRAILAEELDVLPSLTTTQLNERIKLAMMMPSHNLPPPATPFVGRAGEISILIGQLTDPNCRLLTLTGVGGIGKTRLAQEIVRHVASNDFRLFLHGVAYVSLSGTDKHDLLTAVGAGLGIVYSGQQIAEKQLVDYLRELEILIFLDNYEQFRSDTVLLSNILREAPEVKLLLTSRERLNLQQEWLYEVEGLPYPLQEFEEAVGTTYPAIKLFTICAERIHRPIPPHNVQNEVVRICRLVQGMPLALELLAARLKSLTLADILAELESGLDIFSVGGQYISSHQSSLRVTFDASWGGLSGLEQKVFSQLSIFRGGFTREAAVEVAGATLSVLSSLIDKSLIRLTINGRYEIHELLRQYAAEKLTTDPDLKATAQHEFAIYFGDYLRTRKQSLLETLQVETLNEMIPEMDNIRFAWRWLVKNKNINMLNEALWTLAFFHVLRGQVAEGMALVRETLAGVIHTNPQTPDESLLNARLQLFQGTFLHYIGKMDESNILLVRNLEQLRQLGSKQDICWNIAFQGHYSLGMSVPDRPSENIEEGLTIANVSGPSWLQGYISAQLARILLYSETDSLARVEQLISDAVSIGRQLANPWVHCHALIVDGLYEIKQGRYRQAERAFHQALSLAQEINSLWLMGLAYAELGMNAYKRQNFADAKKYDFECMNYFRRMGARRWLSHTHNGFGEIARIEGNYDEAIYQYEACLETTSEFDNAYNISAASNLGHVLLRLSRLEEAGSRFQYSLNNLLQMLQETGDLSTLNRRFWRTGSLIFAGVAGILVATDQFLPASRLMGAAVAAQFTAAPHTIDQADEDDWNRILAQVEALHDEHELYTAWIDGQDLSLEEAIEYALEVIREKMPDFQV